MPITEAAVAITIAAVQAAIAIGQAAARHKEKRLLSEAAFTPEEGDLLSSLSRKKREGTLGLTAQERLVMHDQLNAPIMGTYQSNQQALGRAAATTGIGAGVYHRQAQAAAAKVADAQNNAGATMAQVNQQQRALQEQTLISLAQQRADALAQRPSNVATGADMVGSLAESGAKIYGIAEDERERKALTLTDEEIGYDDVVKGYGGKGYVRGATDKSRNTSSPPYTDAPQPAGDMSAADAITVWESLSPADQQILTQAAQQGDQLTMATVMQRYGYGGDF